MSENWQIGISIAQVVLGASVPAIIAYFGWSLNRRLKSIDQAQWQNRKIIELRLDIYKEVSPKLNSMYCFCGWVGDWKSISPADMIALKRQTDKTINVYRHLFDEHFYLAYNSFINTVFRPFGGANLDARIRSEIRSDNGDRKLVFADKWNPEWDSMFDLQNVATRNDLEETYSNLMNEFRACVGLKESQLK
jgi:hypothetical protein